MVRAIFRNDLSWKITWCVNYSNKIFNLIIYVEWSRWDWNRQIRLKLTHSLDLRTKLARSVLFCCRIFHWVIHEDYSRIPKSSLQCTPSDWLKLQRQFRKRENRFFWPAGLSMYNLRQTNSIRKSILMHRHVFLGRQLCPRRVHRSENGYSDYNLLGLSVTT